MITQQKAKERGKGGGGLTHQGTGRDAVLRPGVAKKQDLGPKLIAKKTRLAKIKETRNSNVLMASNIALHTTQA